MNDKFDELAKAMAQSGTRRAALKKFGVGLAASALATFGLAPGAQAGGRGYGEACTNDGQCRKGLWCISGTCQSVMLPCVSDKDCPRGMKCLPWSTIGKFCS